MNRLRASFLFAAVSVLATACAVPTGSEPGSAETVGSTSEALVASGPIVGFGGKCLSAFGYQNGTKAMIWDCLNLSSQNWRLLADNTIRSSDGLCLSTNGGGTANGTGLILWTCLGQANQRWYTNGSGPLFGQAGKVVSTIGYTSANGTTIGLWDNLNQENQKWTFDVNPPPPPPPGPICTHQPNAPGC